MKRFISLLLITTVLFVSCSSDNNEDHVSDDTTGITTSAESEHKDLNIMQQRALISDDLPDRDFEGREFRIFVWNDESVKYFKVDEESGEIINDSVYKRQLYIEDRFNIKLAVNSSGSSSLEHTVKASALVMSGDDSYELYQLHSMSGPNLSMQGGLYNLYDVPGINFNKPWWPEYVVDELTLMDQMYVFASPITQNIISGSIIYYFNRSLIENYKMTDPYNLVNSGKWTVDKMAELVKDTYRDLNGNNKRDLDDQYGHASFIYEASYSIASAGLEVLDKSVNDLKLTVNNEKTINYI